jgi:hypothetical protein
MVRIKENGGEGMRWTKASEESRNGKSYPWASLLKT